VLTDYASIHPITKIFTTDAEPMNLETVQSSGTWVTVGNQLMKWGGPAPGYPNRPAIPPDNAPNVQDASVYDGVIVRSAFFLDPTQSVFTPGPDGLFVADSPRPTKMAKITDGTSKTVVIAEKYIRSDLYEGGSPSDDTGWIDGWDSDIVRSSGVPPYQDSEVYERWTGIPPNPGPPWYVLSAGSAHNGGFNAVFADGSVHSISYNIDIYVFNSLGTRNGTSDGEVSTTEGVN
jgi:prepilin-type processing-associated H-X9-DG protein